MNNIEKILDCARKYVKGNRISIRTGDWELIRTYYIPLCLTDDVGQSAVNALKEYCMDFRHDLLQHFGIEQFVSSSRSMEFL